MVLPKKKIPPPPKQPGTHTNTEVKEALHARAMRRTIIITAVIILLLAALAVVSSTAQEYQGEEDAPHTPKAVVIVADGLTPYTWRRGTLSNKAPFTRLLNSTGGIYTTLSADYTTETDATPATQLTNLVRLLTGATAATVKPTLQDATSFLRTLKDKAKPVIVAPASYWSSNQMENVDIACTRVGFFDAECTGTSCPQLDDKAYCNAYRKYVSCDGKAELYTNDIITAFNTTVHKGGDLLYVQLASFTGEEEVSVTVGHTLQKRSEINLLDGTVGRIAMALAERTKVLQENWLVIVTSEGANTERAAPLLMAAYSNGQLVQLRRPKAEDGLKTTDLRGTLLKWFNVGASGVDESRLIGICSGGATVQNCN